MPHPSTRSPAALPPQGSLLAMLAERSQIDFEIGFFADILDRLPEYTDALRAHASNLALKGELKDGLLVEQKLVELRPEDPDAHYNLACRYALLKQPELALVTLKRAIELGFRDFRTMIQDRNLESVRGDKRFRALIREYHA